MLQTFIRSGRLHRWLQAPNRPSALVASKELFEKIFHRESFERPFANPSKGVVKDFPEDLQSVTNTTNGKLHAYHRALNVVFARASTHLGNSLVLFYPHNDWRNQYIPASIKYIFQVGSQVKFAVRRHLDSTKAEDIFAKYPHFPMKLYSSKLADSLEVVEIDWIFSHFARYNVSAEDVVVLPLSRE